VRQSVGKAMCEAVCKFTAFKRNVIFDQIIYADQALK
jgi:hypothetical protein